ncbi:hypothetical protein [Mesorhizobium sp.]|uniref:hypothetical protein n=1 Tax=Mesorhizobium sp. TaxID=1871066 RepID=UPI000FE4BCA4|nr:hypothetical protein [Mesorhizobium sp.]RWB05190.1 MAG: hypothetical protein EOQ33_09800 [Mesorhizobium sp.]RWP27106.1 MAG: hypothetical protein EOR02_24435 [Mesorhizobium sp.]TIL39134.1 MAG: hypothetical protein E5Y82_09560 [Mesorhizobium sp.]TIL81495.1 MAG: hypothetical protein E5Y81_02325 [Mesorhizobium sp.]
MKLALSALLTVLALSQAVEAKTKAVATDAKASSAEKNRPPLDNKSTSGITSSDATAAPADNNGPSLYPPAIYFNF